ncbi:hypothetical protein OMAG_001143 [Candidatus Omnitrophus magneticus]|uniref:Uncharacterized protein n=1 Tax=Candidatus Omnitrophus magneticus TaxID=1609969 RepID=A0A0F0CSL0_9BACT|nr:hypothetical protein OMAG_001143 [Candidatus Omnitrophus magneticus]
MTQVVDTGRKKCRGCHEIKLVGEFYRESANVAGYQNKCKACQNALLSKYRIKIRDMVQKPVIAVRKCCDCDVIKPVGDFFKDRYDKYGYQKRCKVCSRVKTLIFKGRHPDYWVDHGKRKYAAIEDKKAFNKNRYACNRESYLRRIDRERSTARGRLYGILLSAKHRAAKKKLPADIDLKWLLKKYQDQAGRCGVTKLPLLFEKNPTGKQGYTPYAPSLHRVNPEKGYTKDNVMLVSVIANLGMNRFGEDAFRIMCEEFYENTHQVAVLSSARFGNRLILKKGSLEKDQ